MFDDEALEVVVSGKEDTETENKLLGGRNRWNYDTFVNWVGDLGGSGKQGRVCLGRVSTHREPRALLLEA